MAPDKILGKVLSIVSKLPPNAVGDFDELLGAILAGKASKAERLARLNAETIAIEEAGKTPFRARGKL